MATANTGTDPRRRSLVTAALPRGSDEYHPRPASAVNERR
jgi:hypothetical protein